jgi:hypothetical protein
MADATQRKGGRPKNEAPSPVVEVTLAPEQLEELRSLVGRYGRSPTAVARYLIERELDDLRRSGVLKPAKPE